MAYNMDFVCSVSYNTLNKEIIPFRAADVYTLFPQEGKEIAHITFEVFRITFKGKNMNECFTLVDDWIKSADGKFSMSIAFSEFGIDPNNKDVFYLNYWRERTPK